LRVRQLFLRMFFHEVRLRFRVLRIFCSALFGLAHPVSCYLFGFTFQVFQKFPALASNEGRDPLL
jgi:hypothetical protein